MTLKVEPGKNLCCVARSPRGGKPSLSLVLTSFHAASSTLALPEVNGVGLYVGLEYIANTEPVLGSKATTEPSRPPRALRATFCNSGSSVSVIESAAFVGARTCSKLWAGWVCASR